MNGSFSYSVMVTPLCMNVVDADSVKFPEYLISILKRRKFKIKFHKFFTLTHAAPSLCGVEVFPQGRRERGRSVSQSIRPYDVYMIKKTHVKHC